MDIGRREQCGYNVVDVIGKIDRLKDSMALKAYVGSMVDKGMTRVALNLAQVTYLDSGALNVLIHCHNMLRSKSSGLVLIEPNEYVADVLNIVGIDRLLTIYPTEEEFVNEAQKS